MNKDDPITIGQLEKLRRDFAIISATKLLERVFQFLDQVHHEAYQALVKELPAWMEQIKTDYTLSGLDAAKTALFADEFSESSEKYFSYLLKKLVQKLDR